MGLWLGAAPPAVASDILRVGYLGLEPGEQEPLSALDAVVMDAGVQGARLAIDNNATGQFTGQEFVLEEVVVAAAATSRPPFSTWSTAAPISC